MVNELIALLGLAAPDYSAAVAVNAAYTLHAEPVEAPQKCCGLCKNGRITHGDGHTTPCPCPDTCECKSVTHPPVVIHPQSVLKECKDCAPKK